jgi:hypothetical protein
MASAIRYGKRSCFVVSKRLFERSHAGRADSGNLKPTLWTTFDNGRDAAEMREEGAGCRRDSGHRREDGFRGVSLRRLWALCVGGSICRRLGALAADGERCSQSAESR